MDHIPQNEGLFKGTVQPQLKSAHTPLLSIALFIYLDCFIVRCWVMILTAEISALLKLTAMSLSRDSNSKLSTQLR